MPVPTYLWRVFDDSSNTTFDPTIGFYAANQTWVHNDWYNSERMAEAISKHLVWANRTPSPFISLSANKDFIRREVQRRLLQHKSNIRLAKIELQELNKKKVLHGTVRDLVRSHAVRDVEWRWVSDWEYLCLLRIPLEIIEIIDVNDFILGKRSDDDDNHEVEIYEVFPSSHVYSESRGYVVYDEDSSDEDGIKRKPWNDMLEYMFWD